MSDIYFAGNSFDISYTKGSYQIKSAQNQGNFNFIRTFLTESERDNIIETYDGEMKAFLYEKLSQHSRLMLRVSSSNLPYNKAFDQKKIVSHFINVIGYNQETDEIKISDGCAPITGGGCYEGWIDSDTIIENWQLMNGEYIELRYDTLDCVKIKEQARRNLKKNLEKYIRVDRAFLKSTIHGHQAIFRLFQDIQASMQAGAPQTLEIVSALNKQLRIEGYLSAKDFVLEKMQESQWDAERCTKYEQLIQLYDNIGFTTMKYVMKKQREDMGKIVERVKEAIAEEKQLLQAFIMKI